MDSVEEIREKFREWCEQCGGDYSPDCYAKPARREGQDHAFFDYEGDRQWASVCLDPEEREIVLDQPHGGNFVINGERLDPPHERGFTYFGPTSVESLEVQGQTLIVRNGMDENELSVGYPATLYTSDESGDTRLVGWTGMLYTENGVPLQDAVDSSYRNDGQQNDLFYAEEEHLEQIDDIPEGLDKIDEVDGGFVIGGEFVPKGMVRGVWDRTGATQEDVFMTQYADNDLYQSFSKTNS